MNLDFSEFTNVLDEDEFEEGCRPVDLHTFIYSREYLGMTITLSPLQFEIIRRGSQIYKEHTLCELYGKKEGTILWRENCKELILLLGKGSGKDLMSALICCYIVYQLLCLKDPAVYYGKPKGDKIDIVNVATNATLASTVFFSYLKTRIELCPWFKGKYTTRSRDIEFKKDIRVHSKDSQGEGTEGLNILAAVLDEIDGFDEGKKTESAKAMYDTLDGTVTSRFDDVGKVILLSFPRSEEGFLMTHYDDLVTEKETIKRRHMYKLDDDISDGNSENEFYAEWDEDHIVSYKFPRIFAIRRPTWDVNPDKTIETFKMAFYRKPEDSAGRYACTPSGSSENAWFKDGQRIDACFSTPNGLTSPTGQDIEILVKPQEKQYYAHVDLARVQDNCSLALAHVDAFKKAAFDSQGETSPCVVIDLVRYWKPDRQRPIDFSDVRDFIIQLKRKGFNIVKVTFDRWHSEQIRADLESIGIETDKLSVARDHYTELALSMGQYMIEGPDIPLLRKELKGLIVDDKGRIDHTGKSGKDLTDAVCGAFFNAATLTPKESMEVEIKTAQDVAEENRRRRTLQPGTIAPEARERPWEGIRLL